MAAFTPSFTIESNSEGTELTFTDTSNYASNDESYTRSTFTTRIFEITDPYSEAILGSPLTIPTEDVVDASLDKDRAISVNLVLSNADDSISYTTTLTFLALNQLLRAFIAKMNTFEDCTCDSEKKCTNHRKINNEIYAAKYNFTFNDLVNAQRHLDFANELTSKDCSC